MKLTKVMIILGMAALMLSGCGKQETPENKQEAAENEYFEVENLKWGMTVDEALKALGTSTDEAAKYDKYTYGAYFDLEDGREIFGEKTKKIHVEFLDATVGQSEPKLCVLMIEYGENADMAKVLENMEKSFGEKADQLAEFGIARSALDSADGDREKSTVPITEYEACDTLHLWKTKTLDNMIPEKQSDAYEDLFETSFLWLSDQSWNEFKEKASLVTVLCSTGESEKIGRTNAIGINAYNMLAYHTWTETLEK